MTPLPTRLIASVRLAGSSGRGRAAGELAAAFEDGGWAARHGHRVPPFVILDARAVLTDLAAGRPLTVPQRLDPGSGERCAAAKAYDDWLTGFARALSRRLGRATLAAVADTARERSWAVGPHLPPLMAAWPDDAEAPDDAARDWEDAYRFLAADPECYQSGMAAWTSLRAIKADVWKPWPTPTSAVSPEAVMWARFAADQPGEKLHQRFDHAAAELYLRAADPPPPADLEARLQDERETLSPIDRPFAESVEEQHPFIGAPTVYTYTLGEYGLFKLTNRSDPRLSTPPRANRPQPFEAHLAWSVGYRGLRTPAGKLRDGVSGGGVIGAEDSQASVLQGVVALMLDDWRSVLARHRMSFHLHRFGASPGEWTPKPGSAVRAILPGKRWKDELLATRDDRPARTPTDAEPGALPPFGVTGLLFRRPSLADAGPARWAFDRRGEPVPDARKWWCGVMLREELERDLGFRAQDVIGHEGSPFAPPVWAGPAGSLPRMLRHLIVIDPPRRTGWVMAVDFAAGRIGLRPARAGTDAPPTDDSFADLREAAVNAVADVLFDLAPV